MGRANRHYAERPGLTEAEAAELERLDQWCIDKAHKQGDIGYTVHHARRDALIAKRDGATVINPASTTEAPAEEKTDDTD